MSKAMIAGMRGVFLVAAKLAELGFVVSPTSRSARGVDLLATNLDGTKTFAVEVKVRVAHDLLDCRQGCRQAGIA